MTPEDFSKKIVDKRISLIKETLTKKGAEYNTSQDRFSHFDKSTEISIHNTKHAVTWEFMVKHIQSIKDMIEAHEKFKTLPSTDMLEEKIGDAINYLILLEGMFKEDIEKYKTQVAEKLDKLKYNERSTQ